MQMVAAENTLQTKFRPTKSVGMIEWWHWRKLEICLGHGPAKAYASNHPAIDRNHLPGDVSGLI
jgi:hypothetical protein